MRRSLTLPILTAVALLLCGCSSSGSSSSTATGDTNPYALSGGITVSAAASLAEAFREIGTAFEAAHPDTRVSFNFASSTSLAQQLIDGAPSDVFASADEANMTALTSAGLIKGEPVVFATNTMAIVTKPGNPEGITSLADLTSLEVVALCGDSPCGTFAQQVLDAAGVHLAESRVARGQNAKATVTAVAEGDAQAGIVYVTDARAVSDQVAIVDIPPDIDAIARYPIASLANSDNLELAGAFVSYVLSPDGQRILQSHGFGPPG